MGPRMRKLASLVNSPSAYIGTLPSRSLRAKDREKERKRETERKSDNYLCLLA